MSTSKHIDRIGSIAVVLALLVTILFMNGETLGIQVQAKTMGYEDRLFDNSRVHTIDIVIDDWDAFLLTAQSEEYSACNVVIDGEAFANVGIRGKGNTSLNTVSSLGSDRYSFKLEFDQYDDTLNYYGLDKLSLNNLIQDNTMMKDYLTYTMMREFGVAAPLCSYVYITVNGEDWGLYLAVEAVEESFLLRNYGSNFGDLYKPDNLSMGGGRGNGMEFDAGNLPAESQSVQEQPPQEQPGQTPGGDQGFPGMPGGENQGEFPGQAPQQEGQQTMDMGSSDTKLQYLGDDPASYSAIFDSAKTDVTDADQQRVIEAVKLLNSSDAASAVDVEQVLRYFAVHNFVVNADSYTGSMVHNYYLYEEDSKLSMIPWDYNLAFGTFHTMDASAAVNDSIDTPLSVSNNGDRPMAEWFLKDFQYLQQYHQYLAQFLDTVDLAGIIEDAYGLIAPYVDRDPTKFCTYEEFEAGVETLKTFCTLRAESVRNQLAGSTVPVDTAGLDLTAMGTMNVGGQQAFPGGEGFPEMPGQNGTGPSAPQEEQPGQWPSVPQEGQVPQGGEGQFPGGMTPPQQGEPQGWPQTPGQGEPTTPAGNEGVAGNDPNPLPDMGHQTPDASQTDSRPMMLMVSLAVLLAGLLFAVIFKR